MRDSNKKAVKKVKSES